MKATRNKNFLGDFELSSFIVHENVDSSRPRVPQRSTRGGKICNIEHLRLCVIQSDVLPFQKKKSIELLS